MSRSGGNPFAKWRKVATEMRVEDSEVRKLMAQRMADRQREMMDRINQAIFGLPDTNPWPEVGEWGSEGVEDEGV